MKFKVGDIVDILNTDTPSQRGEPSGVIGKIIQSGSGAWKRGVYLIIIKGGPFQTYGISGVYKSGDRMHIHQNDIRKHIELSSETDKVFRGIINEI